MASSFSCLCKNCGISFDTAWCKKCEEICLFCKKYLPMRDTYEDILQGTRECYLWSGWTDEAAYNSQHVAYITAWCAKWHIRRSSVAEKLEKEILAFRNWTREYWN